MSMSPLSSPEPVRLLVVDDEELVLEYYRRLLERVGYAIATAGCAEEALERLREQTFDLVVLDLVMPGTGGMGVLRALWRQPYPPEVVVVSGCLTCEREREARQWGAQAVLAKSQGSRVLLEAVARWVRLRQDPILTYLRTHLGEIATCEALAARFHVCARTVNNRVKLHTGQSFRAFLQGCRRREAQRLLGVTDLNIKQIAFRVGFHSSQAFTRAFKRWTDRSPRQYRAEIHTE